MKRRWAPVTMALLLSIVLAHRLTAGADVPPVSTFTFSQRTIESQRNPSSAWGQYSTRTLDLPAPEALQQARCALSRYGGWLGQREKATGFFYTKQIGDRWWLVDPDGYLFVHKGVVSVRPGTSRSMILALRERFGTETGWAQATTELLWANGFNGTGAWSDTGLLRQSPQPMVYTQTWSFMAEYGKRRGGTYQQAGHTGYPNDAIFVFDPEFAIFADAYAQRLAMTRDDPYLIGHFSDNELPFPSDLLDKYLSLPHSDAGYKAARDWVLARHGGESIVKGRITVFDRFEFIGYVAERYFSIVKQAISKYDPNHLYLGPRLHGAALNNRYIFEAARGYVDVIGVNYYNTWAPDMRQMRYWEQWSGSPILITEWYTKAADAGLPNTSGAGWIVRTQADRGDFYQNFVLGLLESKVVVGWHWFKYHDNDPDDLTTDPSNRDANKGIVRIDYSPYEPLLARMALINALTYELIRFLDELLI